jgi:hypothetical protein
MNFRAVPALPLKELWVAAAHYPDINDVDIGTIDDIETPPILLVRHQVSENRLPRCQVVFSCDLIKTASQLDNYKSEI